MIVARLIGVALFIFGLLCGLAIIYGAHTGTFAAGLLRTWSAFGVCTIVGLLIASAGSSVRGSDRVVRNAGLAILGLGAVSGFVLILNKAGAYYVSDTMQPWAVLVACVIVGGVILFGSRA